MLTLTFVAFASAISVVAAIMERFIQVHLLKRWAVVLGLALVTAFAVHLTRTYPWYRLYLSQATSRPFSLVPAPQVQAQGNCFVPKDALIEAADPEYVAPIGSFQDVGWSQGQCFHYASRFGPYTGEAWGNTYIEKAQEYLGLRSSGGVSNNLLWYANLLAENDPDRFPHIDWSDASTLDSCQSQHKDAVTPEQADVGFTKPRLAFVLRCYQGFAWSTDDILHLRAIIWELRTGSRNLPFDVDVHLLLEVKDAASHASMYTGLGRRQILRGMIPKEFWSLVSMWNVNEMTLRYPLYGDFRAGIQAAGSYRGCLLPLQRFAAEHTEYDNIINWEMDTRFTHTYDHLVESIHNYAYKASVQTYTRWPVQGIVSASSSDMDGRCRHTNPDIVVLSPVRDPRGSDWYWEYDVQGYSTMQSTPRAASIGTNMWLSRRTLMSLENVTADQRRSLFCEAMAPTLAIQSFGTSIPRGTDQCDEQLKLVHFPHPTLFKYDAAPATLDGLLNPRRSALSKRHEEALKDTSYYYASSVSNHLYIEWQQKQDACIKPLVLHPIKDIKVSAGTGAQTLKSGKSGKGSSLCAESSRDDCASLVKAHIERFTGMHIGSKGMESLFKWELEAPHYVSRRNWIMNSSTRDLILTIVICITAAAMLQLYFSRSTKTGGRRGSSTDYIPLSREESKSR